MIRSRHIPFSQKLVIVYIFIAGIPFTLLMIAITSYLFNVQFRSLSDDALNSVQDSAQHIEDSVGTMESIEGILSAYKELNLFFLSAGENINAEDIVLLRDTTDFVERLLFIMPQIYGIRFFINNEHIPERSPVIYHERRLEDWNNDRYQYNVVSTLSSNIESTRAPSFTLTRSLQENRRHIGYLQIAMKMETVFPDLLPQDPLRKKFVFVDGTPLFEHDERLVKLIAEKTGFSFELYAPLPDRDSGVVIVKDGAHSYAAAWQTIPRLSMLIVQVNSAAMITGSITWMRTAVFAVYLLSILLLFFITEFATGKLMSRLYAIMDGMQRLRSGQLDVHIAVGGNDEVTRMAETFTSMTEQIQLLITKNREEQKLLADTEIKAMQNQINSHFLYNVLETIKMQAELHDQHDIVESITILGRMLRYCLRWRIQYVALQEELEYAQAYVAILNIRNDYQIELINDIDPVYNSIRIPKMLLQPLIENAFSYAIEPYGKDGSIRLFCRDNKEEGILKLCVQDYGYGFKEDRLDEIRSYLSEKTESTSSGRIGLKNIQQRLEVYYGSEFRIHIDSKPGSGTCVCVPLPLSQTDAEPGSGEV